jgi:MFS family permease
MTVTEAPEGAPATDNTDVPRNGTAPRLGAFSSFAESEFSWFFAGNMAFFMGMQMQFVLRGYLAFELTNSASALGLIAIMIALPMLVASPFGGAIADRVNKRTLLIVTQTGAALASVLVAVLIIGGWLEFWHLLAVSLATGIVFSFNMPARQAVVPNLVPRHKLTNAISLQMGGMTFTQIVAPALGGLLIAPFGVGWVYMLTAALFCVATASEFHLPKHGMTSQASHGAMLADIGAGFRYAFQHRLIRMLIGTSLLVPLLGFPVQQLLPVFARDVFDKGPAGLGLLAGMTGVGGLIGAMVSANMDREPRKGRLLMIGGAVTGLALLSFSLAPRFEMAMACLAAAGVGQMLFQATNNTVIQSTLAPEVRARVMSMMMMSFGLMPLGVVPITAAADAIGPRAAISIAAGVFLVAFATLYTLSSRLRNLRLEPLAHATLSPARAAERVAAGELTQEQADRLSGRQAEVSMRARGD